MPCLWFAMSSAAVLLLRSCVGFFLSMQDTCGGGKGQELNLLRLDWSGRLLEKMDVNRIDEPYGAQNHPRCSSAVS